MIAHTSPSPNPDHWIARCCARLRFGEFLRSAADWLAVYLFVFGSAVLIVKLAMPQFWPHVLWLAVGAIPVAATAWLISGRDRFSRNESIALLDSRLQAGGLLMTLTEAPSNEWEERLPQLESLWKTSLPQLRPIRFARQMLPALAFVAVACLVPPREVEAGTELRSTAGQQAAQSLEELLTELDKAEVLEEEEKQELQDEIDKLLDETKETPLTHEKWETVDALQERMRLRLDETSTEVGKAQEALATLRHAADGEQLTMPPEALMELEKAMLETLQKMMEKGAFENAPESLKNELQKLMKNGQFKLPEEPGERQEMLDSLSEFLDKESDELSELRSKCKGGPCQKCGDGDCQGGQCQGMGQGTRDGDGRPGRGGVNRGRGDAPLTWGDESNEEGIKFKEAVLPRGTLDQPRDEVVGISVSTPDVEPAGPIRRQGSRAAGAASGDETWSRNVRPRHRSVVRRYFDEQNRESASE